jgi:uncharacterized protein (TIGR00255 family)
MTAFAHVEGEQFSWQVRSVNHRYLDASFRLPDQYRHLEPTLRTLLKKYVNRGKVEAVLRPSPAQQGIKELNHDLLDELHDNLNGIATQFPEAQQPTTLELLRWPGVLESQTSVQGQDHIINTLFQESLVSLVEMRIREGTETAKAIEDKLLQLTELIAVVRDQLPTLLAQQKARLLDRVAELQSNFDQDRIHQELIFLANKADVAEELERLTAHILEVKRALQAEGASGRRLDFLMQELNREANTLSSKSIAVSSTLNAVDMKVIIEQMREQVQNIE